MQTITLGQLVAAVGGRLLGTYDDLNTAIDVVDMDSRAIHEGALFLPIVGERFDGHTYIDSALENGAAGVLTDRELECYRANKFYVKVENTEVALKDLAVWYKSLFPIPFVAVTGSVGKTTAKDMIACVLGQKYNVLKTEGNFNNNLGMPLTILRLTDEHTMCVLEMGMDRFGEIDYLAGAVKPDVGVITNIGDAHIERLGSRENIFKAKCEMLPHVKPDGLLVLNGDDDFLPSLKGKTKPRAVFCGGGEGLDYTAHVTGGDGLSYIACHVAAPAMDETVEIPALGEHMVYPVTMAVAVAERFGLTSEEIARGLSSFIPTKMRMNVHKRADGIAILDDCYNANPQSMRAAISVLSGSRTAHKVAILGDMLELGEFSESLHTGVGEFMSGKGIDCLIAIGPECRYMAKGAEIAGVANVYSCEDKAAALEVLAAWVKPDTTFLVKASRGMRLEEISAYLLEQTKEG